MNTIIQEKLAVDKKIYAWMIGKGLMKKKGFDQKRIPHFFYQPFTLSEFQFCRRVRPLRIKMINIIRKKQGWPIIDKITPSHVLVQQIVTLHHTGHSKKRKWQLAILLFRNIKEYTPPGIFPPFFEPVRNSLLRKLVLLINQYSLQWRYSAYRHEWRKYLNNTGLDKYFRGCIDRGHAFQI
jgi:hypothetical protein